MTNFKSKLKEIVEIDDSWEVKSFYGHTTYYTFFNNTYCVSIFEYKNNKARTSYVFSKKGEMLYRCFTDKDILKFIEQKVHKSRNKCQGWNWEMANKKLTALEALELLKKILKNMN